MVGMHALQTPLSMASLKHSEKQLELHMKPKKEKKDTKRQQMNKGPFATTVTCTDIYKIGIPTYLYMLEQLLQMI